ETRFGTFALPLAVCAGAAALVWVAAFGAATQLRRTTEADAASTRQNLANTLAEREASSVRAIDITLTALRQVWVSDRAEFNEAVESYEHLLHKERVIQVAVLDAAGNLAYSRLPPTGHVSFSDRAYYNEHLLHPDRDMLYISAPVMGRITGEWAIQLTRPIRGAGGRFEGVIIVAVPPPALEQPFRDIDLGPQSVITLARTDGQILARTSDLPLAARVPVVTEGRTPGAGQIAGRSAIDGVERIFAYRDIDDYGLVMFVGQAVDAVLAPYESQRNWIVAFAIAATLLLMCVGVLLALRQRDQALYRAAQERVMLELHDGCIQSIYAVGLNLQGTRSLLRVQPHKAGELIAQAEADLNIVIHDLRAFMGSEKPVALSGEQLRAEIVRTLPRMPHTSFHVDVQPEALDALGPEAAAHILRIVREAAANVARHSAASHAIIRLVRADGHFLLEIEDNGRGILASPTATGLGLAHIAARARKLHGTAHIETASAGGTRVSVRFPEES
ncbi:MAG TPA: cache domain-containing protein, partial [Usitatibacter sp.]|nr:cache domain-containing protein [Usitatibacter sp.]